MPATDSPARSGAVLTALLLAAAVCNLTTGGATVALPGVETSSVTHRPPPRLRHSVA